MKSDKEIDRELNQHLLANEQAGWLREEMELIKEEKKLSTAKILKLKTRITKLKKIIRGKKRVLKLLEDFDKELDKEFESIYG